MLIRASHPVAVAPWFMATVYFPEVLPGDILFAWHAPDIYSNYAVNDLS